MKLVQRNILALAGVSSSVFGFMFAIPTFLREQIILSMLSALFVIVGLILLAISFGDNHATPM